LHARRAPRMASSGRRIDKGAPRKRRSIKYEPSAKLPATKGSLNGCRAGKKLCGARKRKAVKTRSAMNGTREVEAATAGAEVTAVRADVGRHQESPASEVGGAAASAVVGCHHGPRVSGVGLMVEWPPLSPN